MDYLGLPFALKNGYLNKTDLYRSLAHSVGLIISSRQGSIPFEPDYGCIIWEKEYSDLYSANRSDLRASIRNAIDKFEKRLYNVSVSLSDIDSSGMHPLGLTIKVSGYYKENDEERKFEETFNLD